MANVIANGFKQYIADGTINLGTDTIYAALFANGFTFDKDAHDTWADISGSEISGDGYPAGGVELTGKAVSHNDSSDKGVFDADDVVFPAVTLTNARYIVLYRHTGGKLIGAWDLGANQSPAGVDFKVKWNAGGILTLSQGS